DVGHRARQQIAGLRLVVKAERQLLDVGEQRSPQLIAAALRRRLAEVVLGERGQTAHPARDDDADAEDDEQANVLLAYAIVYVAADQLRYGEVEECVGDDRDVARDHQPAVVLVVRKDALERLHCGCTAVSERANAFDTRFITGTAAASSSRSSGSRVSSA